MKTNDSTAGRFGTFGGVFTPCTLTILGVIMFLRFGHVVGQAGIYHAIAIVAAAQVISLLTGLSLSAIATNTRVKGGGAYFVISRSLGMEFGGAIGVVFFFAQAISVAMYVIGFSEALLGTVSIAGATLPIVASVVNLFVFACVYIGAGWTIKLQYGILAILVAALISFYWGAFESIDPDVIQGNLHSSYLEGHDFFTMFALFFPAVTGIMAGANMSGDLANPARSIPRGTLLAVAVTGAVYLSQAVLLGCVRSSSTLLNDSLVMWDVARWPVLITAGVFAATISSALGSMMGAPRILQAFARDDVFAWLKPLAKGSGASGEPRRATVLTFAIAQVAIVLGDLDAIAPVITMAFMITYATLNLATFYEAITKNPSYRPRFRYCHWSLSLLGAVGCVAVMLLIDWRWAIVSMAAMALLHWYIGRKEIESQWGDMQAGLTFARTRKNLLKLEDAAFHPKNWRPIILAFSGSGWSRPHLAVYGHWFTTGHGLLSLGYVIQGDIDNRLERRRNQQRILRNFIAEEGLQAFPAVVVAPFVSDGIESLVQCHGIGMLSANTVLLGWPNDADKAEPFLATLRTVAALERSIIAVRFAVEPEDPWCVPPGTIDVWWRGRENGDLMLLLAHLLTLDDEWRNHTIRLLRVIPSEAGREDVRRHLVELADAARIHAEPVVIVAADAREAIQRTSDSAALVFLGFDVPEQGREKEFFERMQHVAGRLERVVFVDSIGGMSLET
ncbi:MAG: amino acid permease [Pirellulales bacterium]